MNDIEVAIKFYESQIGKSLCEELFGDCIAENKIEDAEKEGITYINLIDRKYVEKLTVKYLDGLGGIQN